MSVCAFILCLMAETVSHRYSTKASSESDKPVNLKSLSPKLWFEEQSTDDNVTTTMTTTPTTDSS